MALNLYERLHRLNIPKFSESFSPLSSCTSTSVLAPNLLQGSATGPNKSLCLMRNAKIVLILGFMALVSVILRHYRS
eukprot:2738033-Amphidinium_carterae.1